MPRRPHRRFECLLLPVEEGCLADTDQMTAPCTLPDSGTLKCSQGWCRLSINPLTLSSVAATACPFIDKKGSLANFPGHQTRPGSHGQNLLHKRDSTSGEPVNHSGSCPTLIWRSMSQSKKVTQLRSLKGPSNRASRAYTGVHLSRRGKQEPHVPQPCRQELCVSLRSS